MKILVACEESQAVTKELRQLGHEAYSCDIIPCSGGHPEWHIQGDALKLIYPDVLVCSLEPEIEDEMFGTFKTADGTIHELPPKWDMILAFPPCTYLTNAGARHLYKGGVLNQERYEKGLEAKGFFLKFWNAPCERIAIENPTPSRVFELPEKTQVIQPWQFGHPFTKRTQLWLKGLPPLQPTEIVEPERTWCPSGSYSGKHNDKHRGMFTKDRAKNRSKTFPGIAKAMAEQWAGNANKDDKEKEEMELKVKAPTFPEVIEFNFDELKQEITERASTYVNLVYGEEQIQDAKKDRATLNKFVKALSDERIKIKKECLKPYEDFEAKIKELDGIVSKAIANIDNQVKGYEEKKKQEKLDEITNFFNSTDHPEWLHIAQIMCDKWLNASVSMKAVMGEMDSRLEQIANDLETLANLPEFGFEAVEVYKTTLDLNKALNEGRRLLDIQKRKAEAERLKAEMEAEQARLAAEVKAQKQEEPQPVKEAFPADAMNPPEPPKQWVSFKALLTVDQAKELKRFFDDRAIEFEAI